MRHVHAEQTCMFICLTRILSAHKDPASHDDLWPVEQTSCNAGQTDQAVSTNVPLDNPSKT